MTDEIRQNCDGFSDLPLLSGPPNLPFPRAHITVFQVDAETPTEAYTAFIGPASYALQAHLRTTFDTSRAKVKAEGFDEQWATITARGNPADSTAVRELCDEWGCCVDALWATVTLA